jgi:hypothetical protein
MNRRNFLQMIGLAVPAAVVLPNLARRYFFAPRGGWPVKPGPPYTFANGVYHVKDGGRIAFSGALDSLEVEYDDNARYFYGLDGTACFSSPTSFIGKFRAVRGNVTLRGVFHDRDFEDVKQYLERTSDTPLAGLYHERDPEKKIFITEYRRTWRQHHG